MSYEDFCKENKLAPTNTGRQTFDSARRTVAVEMAFLFGVCVSNNEADRFLSALETAAESVSGNVEWNDATSVVPLRKRLGHCRYSVEVISEKGILVAFDYKSNAWVEVVIEDEKVTYIPAKIKAWTAKPFKE